MYWLGAHLCSPWLTCSMTMSDGAKGSYAWSLLMRSCSNYSLLIRSCSKWNSYSPWLNLSVSILRNFHAISLISSHKHAHSYILDEGLVIYTLCWNFIADQLLLLCQQVRQYPRKAFTDAEHPSSFYDLGLNNKFETLFLELIWAKRKVFIFV